MKKYASYFFLFFALLVSWRQAGAQNISNRGKDFWVGYGHHQFMEPGQTNSQEMILYFSAEQAAVVTVTVRGLTTTQVTNYSVPANSVVASNFMPKTGTADARLYDLPPTFGGNGGERIFRQSIHIESTVPIVAYAHIFGSVSSGATMLLPTESWGYSYTSINSQQIDAAGPGFSWVYVVSKENNTRIRVTPSATTRLNKPAGVPFDTTLQRGEILQIVGQGDASGNGVQFTGTTVKSIGNAAGQCYPIAVFSGSSRTRGEAVPCGTGSGRDNDMQQCFPQQAWGKKYFTAPFSSSNGATLLPASFQTSVYKVAVKDPATVVKRNGVTLTGIINGSYYQFSSNTADVIESDIPVMIGQFMSGSSACNPGSSGDPEMVFLSPIEQAIKNVGFYRNNRQSIFSNYVTVVIPTAGVTSLRIDGSATFNHTYPHPNAPGYTVVVKGWSASQAQALMSSDSAFTAITYGLGAAESYAYNAGTFINNLNAVGSIYNPSDTSSTTTSHPFTCTNTPVKLSVLLRYPTPPTRLVWRLSAVGGGLAPNTDVTDNAPTPVGTQVVNGVTYFKYDLPGTYSFTTVGTYTIPILATHPSVDNCNNTEEVSYNMEVKGKPSTDFAITHTGCVLDTVHFTGQTTSANGFNLNQWLYTFPDATTSISKDTGKLFAGAGTYNVNLRIVSTEGCVGDTVKQVTIYPKPVAAFTSNVPAACQGTAISFTSTAAYTGTPGTINNYYWDFGDGTIVNAPTNAAQSHTYTIYGTYTVRHAAGVSGLCVSDTVTRTVTVHATPTTSFTYPAGCLPATGVVQFNSTALAPDGQAITGHLWTFGDPPSGPANTSTLPNPSHTYPGFGSYTITYRTTTTNGCFKDTTVNATFNLAPSFNYPALAPICSNNAGTVSVATATVTNGVPGFGVYNGPGTTTAGVFDPVAAGAGTHTIWYVFTANSGCKDSISQTITVAAAPDPSFSIPSAGCLPTTGQVSFTYTGTAQPGQTYSWNFGDPASGVNNTSTLQNPTHNYSSGNYTITLQVTNPSTGCVETESVTQTFNVTPQLNYPALAATCENLTSVSVATATVTNGVTGNGVYSGPGTTAAGMFNPSAAGPGTHTITYTFTGSGNCLATATQTIVVNAKPNASFTYPAAACLPATGIANFTYNGSLSAGQTYAWNFGDPASGVNNTSTLQNPSHTYTNTGNYNVSVVVTNTNGCVDDSLINITFSVTPALSYPALAAICSNAAPVNIGTATVTNAVLGNGVYSGQGTTPAGNFDPAIAGPGNHTITYTFTSTANCVASTTQTIRVNAAPSAAFTANTTACLPANGNVAFTYTGTAQAGQTYAWDFGDPASGANNTSTLQNPTHNFAEGNFRIILTVTNPATGCVDKDTLTQTFALTPALNYPALTASCENLTNVNVATATVTNGVLGNGVYSGPGTTAAGIFNPSVAGPGTHTITYTFTSTANCVATVTQTIVVNAKPNASFTYPTAACLPTTGIANFTYNGSMSAGQTYAWNFGDPASGANNTSALQNPSHTYTNTGNYNVSVTVTNANGCIDDSLINITFSVTPALNYPALAATCENLSSVSVATATVTNGVLGNGVYSGPGTTAAGVFNPSVAGPGTHTITYTFTSTANCVATVTQTIVVNAKPNASFTYPTAACLPTTGIANFTYNGSMSAGQTYAWNFGDPASGANNTSPLQNPSHTYTNTGNYNVSVTVTNANGCVDDSLINITFSVTPALNYPALAAVCENLTNVNVATATVTNGVLGNGVYSGPGTNAAGVFNPSVAGPGTHTITYTFTSTGNCIATVTQTIVVNPKPVSAFTVPANICLGQQALVTDNSNIPAGSITTWKWFFGDGNTATYTNGNPFNYLYGAFGTYIVKLVTVSANGCESDTARQTIVVGTVPVASFTMPASVCMPDGVTFTNNSSVADGSTLTYAWNFGDPASGANNTSSAINPTHIYATAGSYSITLRATGGNGCFKDSIQVFDKFFNKSVANFDVTPIVLCQGADNVFTDRSTAPNSTISTRLWIFGDGSTSNAANPTKRYTNPGVYEVKLVVTNAQGCISDTFRRSITVHLQPVVDAGPSFVVAQGSVIQFQATGNDNSGNTRYLWSPATGLSSATSLTPQLTAVSDQTYTLTATGSGNCTATDFLTVKILKPLKIPNAFSPNGDGINDTWVIDNLSDYPGAIVEVFNRYGQLVFKSTGYSTPWNGTTNNRLLLPLATYYYVIQLKNGFKPLSGSITIIK